MNYSSNGISGKAALRFIKARQSGEIKETIPANVNTPVSNEPPSETDVFIATLESKEKLRSDSLSDSEAIDLEKGIPDWQAVVYGGASRIKNRHFKSYLLKTVPCYCCHETPTTYHHIVPRTQGGTDEIRNLVPLCHVCHDDVEAKKEDLSSADIWKNIVVRKASFTADPDFKSVEVGDVLESK